MPFNGAGVFNRIFNWQNDSANNIDITDSRMDGEDDGFATGLSTAICRDGQSTITNNIPFSTHKITGLGNGAARTDSVALGQVQDGTLNWIAAGGSADAITATYSPAHTVLTDGLECKFRAASANATTTPTFSPDGLTAHTITKLGGTALVAGDIAGNLHELILRYNLANTRWELLNPAISGPPWAVAGGTADAITATYSPAIGTLIDGLRVDFRASAANATTTPTFAPNGLTAHTITKRGGSALVAGDIPGALAEVQIRYNLANTRWELLNPAAAAAPVMHAQAITASGNFTAPTGTLSATVFKFIVTGGGGGAGTGGTVSSAGGGGAGATAIYYASGLVAGNTYAATVGAAGTAGSAGANAGGNGGSSSIVIGATTVTAAGGAGAVAPSVAQGSSVAAVGGAATNGTLNLTGGSGGTGLALEDASSVVLFPSGGIGGASFWGGGGGGGPAANAGAAAGVYGAGGGGAGSNNAASSAGGAGGAGVILVEWVL